MHFTSEGKLVRQDIKVVELRLECVSLPILILIDASWILVWWILHPSSCVSHCQQRYLQARLFY